MAGSDQLARRLGTYFMIGAVIVAYVYVLDPTDRAWGAEAFPPLKYLPIELTVVALLLFIFGAPTARRPAKSILALAALFIMLLAGSVYTLLVVHNTIEHTFLGRGLNLLVVFPSYLMFGDTRETRLFLRALRVPTLATALLLTAQVFIWLAGARFVAMPHIFHEEVFLVAGAATLAYASMATSLFRWPIALILLAGCVFTVKNTGFLAATIAAAVLAVLIWQKRPRDNDFAAVLRRTATVEAALLFAALALFLVTARRDLLPSGSPEVRLVTYANRLSMFVDSPIVGQWFVGDPVMELPRRLGTLVTPSHSDVLDVLAFGGIVAFALLSVPLLQAVRWGIARAARRGNPVSWPPVFFLTVILIYGMEMVFNPVWHQPKLALIFWISVGYLLATSRRGKNDRTGGPAFARARQPATQSA